jgi:hypothetical protein
MTRRDLIAESILSTKTLLGRYLAGFNDVTVVRQTPDLPNHVAWSLGHLALTMYRVVELIDAAATGREPAPKATPPAGEFVTADGFGGSKEKGRFDTEAVSFGSRPEERHDRFPSLLRCTEIYNNACEALATKVRSVEEGVLDRPVRWGTLETPVWAVCMRMVFHNGMHTGQIADLRRALGFKSIF